MTNAFTAAERKVAEDVATDPLNVANDNDIEAGGYLGPIAAAVLRGDLSEKAMASLARELLQRYERDVKSLVCMAQDDIDEEETERLARTQRTISELPPAVTFRLH